MSPRGVVRGAAPEISHTPSSLATPPDGPRARAVPLPPPRCAAANPPRRQSDIYGDLETEFASDVYLRGRAGEDFDATLARVSSDRSVGTQGGTSPEV